MSKTKRKWSPPKDEVSCRTCKTKFKPANNRIRECYACVPKEHRGFNNRTRGKYGRDFGYVAFFKMLEEQGNGCKICGTEIIAVATVTNAAIDHCHSTGKVRGILCRTCNLGLGYFSDDISKLEGAIKYLEEKPNNFEPDKALLMDIFSDITKDNRLSPDTFDKLIEVLK